MRKRILFHLLACGMLACTPDPKEGEHNSGTVNVPGVNDSPITRHNETDTISGTKGGGIPEEMTPPDASQTNEGSKTSGAAGQ